MVEKGDYVYHIGDMDKKLRVVSIGIFNITAIEEGTGITLKRSSAEFEMWPPQVRMALADDHTCEGCLTYPDCKQCVVG